MTGRQQWQLWLWDLGKPSLPWGGLKSNVCSLTHRKMGVGQNWAMNSGFSHMSWKVFWVKPRFSDTCITVNIDPAVFCIQESLQFDLAWANYTRALFRVELLLLWWLNNLYSFGISVQLAKSHDLITIWYFITQETIKNLQIKYFRNKMSCLRVKEKWLKQNSLSSIHHCLHSSLFINV